MDLLRKLSRGNGFLDDVFQLAVTCEMPDALVPLPHDREQRPFDRVKDGLVGGMRRPADCLGEGPDREMVLVLDLGAQAVEKLGKNEPGVSPGTGEGGVSNRPA